MNDTDTALAELLRRLPKAELHCHLDGSLRPSTLYDLSATGCSGQQQAARAGASALGAQHPPFSTSCVSPL